MKHSQTGIAKKFLFLVVGLLCAIGASAQSITVSGVVTDPEGEPLIGASILVEGTSTGTATNIDGEFTVSCSPNATLVVSYVGMQTQRVPVADRTTVNVQMSDGGVQLNEVSEEMRRHRFGCSYQTRRYRGRPRHLHPGPPRRCFPRSCRYHQRW